MNIILYDYFLPYRSLFSSEIVGESIRRFQDFNKFYDEWKKDEESTIIIPLHTFNEIGLDIRKYFNDFGRNDQKRFILIGNKNQIAFCLSQNEFFLRNNIEEIQLPVLVNALETIIRSKMYL
ncbi:MAG: hypothetical protein DRH57_09200 [Candidatus Cloacimonadota bacterium]|nr:MAG: hypothetical protein DRH57_09200 [Candidatus Cloacimonadota bacterium]